MKPATKYSLLLLFVSTCLLSYCSKAPTAFERENPNDPDNPVYNIPNSKDFQVQIKPGKTIQISWTDTAKYIDGYVLSKSLNGSNFEVLDTLNASLRSYNDITGKLAYNTIYSLYSYRSIKNGSNNSDTSKTSLYLGKINLDTLSSSSDTSTFNVSWQFDSSWPFIVVAKLKVYNDPSVYDIKYSTTLDTLYNQETSFEHELLKTFDYYYLSFDAYLNQEDLDNDNAYDSLNIYPYGYLNINFNPVITSTQIINESKVILNWKDNSTFEDGFQILRSHSDKTSTSEIIATLPPNTTIFVDTLSPFLSERLDPFGGYESFDTFYSIRAIKGSSKTSSDKITKLGLKVTKPILYTNENSGPFIDLRWTVSSTSYVKNLILERSVDNSDFKVYKTFDKHTSEYTVTELDTSKTYRFRLRTIVSQPSNTIISSYFHPLIVKMSLAFPGATSIRSSKTDKYLVASSGYYNNPFSRNEVVVFDLESGAEIYRTSPFDNPVDGVDINEDKHLIGMVSSRDKSVRIVDFLADTIVFEKLKVNYSLYDIEFSSDGNYFYTVSSFSALNKYSLLTNNIIFSSTSRSQTESFRGLSISPTGDSIAVSINGGHPLFSPSGTLINFPSFSNNGILSQGVSFSKSGKFLTTIRSYTSGGVQLTSNGSVFFKFNGQYADMHYTDNYLATLFLNQLKVYDLRTEELSGYRYISIPNLTSLRYSNTHDYFFLGTNTSIKLFELSDTKAWLRFDN